MEYGEFFDDLKEFLSAHIGEVGTILAVLCMYIEYRQSVDRYRTLLFFVTAIGALTSMGIGLIADSETKKNQSLIDALITGGEDTYSLITMKIKKGLPQFYITNPSPDFSLYDIDCDFITVSSRNNLVIDYWAPQSAGRFETIRSKDSVEIDTNVADNEMPIEHPEQRFNFFIACKNGKFHEQVVVRRINGSLYCIVQIIKNGKVVYSTPNLNNYLYSDEKVFAFQPEMQGVDEDVVDPVFEKMKKTDPKMSIRPSVFSKKQFHRE